MQYSPSIAGFSVDHLISLDFFSDWLVGFTNTFHFAFKFAIIFSIGLGAITLGFPNHELEFLSLLFVPAIAVSRKDKTITTKKSDRKSKVGSFGFKSTGSAFFQIKQKGVENYNIIKAICLIIAGRESKPIKADSAGCYQLSLTSRIDVQKVVDFFSSPNNHPLYGYKLSQYIIWLAALKTSSRYAQIIQL